MSADATVSDVALDPPSLVWLDPATLVAHPANVRDEVGDVRELASSIAVTGVIEPLVVIPLDDGAMRILAGHRRAAAAVAAGLDAVPCLVRPDLAGADDEQLACALAENLQRRGISVQEEARAYAQLSAFPGWSAKRIAQATGRDELSVRRSIEASMLAPELQPAAISGQLSLEDAARVASFAGDPDTYATLLQLTSDGGLRHALVRAERRRGADRHAAEVRERLEAAGTRIIERPRHSDVALKLDSLQDDGSGGLDPAEHAAACEGHAVYVDDYDGEAVPVCLDPARFGHRPPRWYRHETEEQAAARLAA
jgi:ParB family chromosome partitioning protein